ncbi:MAG: aggregation factor core protein MAFp3, isoform C, partial [Pseudomonadota bacterium]
MKTALATAFLLAATSAQAGFVARFVEGAPKDTFVIEAAPGACATGPLSVTFDLTGSDGKLIFDVTDAGAGVEVFQPFELVRGAERVTAFSDVTDGDTLLRLEVSDLSETEQVA